MVTMASELTLPCGSVLPNRLAKAAMTEGLADTAGLPTAELERLYGLWSDGGAGLLLSGNVQIDRDHLERPGNVTIDRDLTAEELSRFCRWTSAATRGGNHFWAQISHAGRQTMKPVNPHPKAPSAVKLALPGGEFGEPVALEGPEIETLITRFARAARLAREGGFTGVQVHGAHGYLISQFLSPRSNLRTDKWGGSLENRARFLLEVVGATREAVGPDFPVAVKLNSADFQRGGFAFEDSLVVAGWLEEAGIDLLEISGGTYEQPKLLGIEGTEPAEEQGVKKSTIAREAYFVDFAKAMKETVNIPLMVTGGFRSAAAIEQVLGEGAADVIGIGRPMCADTDGPAALLRGEPELARYEKELSLFPSWLGFLATLGPLRTLAGFATQFWFYSQLYALGETGHPDRDRSVFSSFLQVQRRHKKWLRQRG